MLHKKILQKNKEILALLILAFLLNISQSIAIDYNTAYDSAYDIYDILGEGTNRTGNLNITFQARSCDDASCDAEIFVGPDNTSATYFENSTLTELNTTLTPNNQFFQYMAYFHTEDLNYTPMLFNVTVDYNLPPVVSLDDPVDFANLSAALDFNYTATDGDLDTCELWGNWTGGWHLNESFVSPSNGSVNGSSVITIEDGQYVWSVYCNDTGGNYNNTVENRTLTIDATPPLVLIVSPTATTYTTSSASLDYVAVDTNLGTVWYTKDSGVTNTSLTGNITLSSLSNADYTLILYANDTFGNLNETNVTFTVSVSTTTTTTPAPAATGGGSYSGVPPSSTAFSSTTSVDLSTGDFVALSTAQNAMFTVKGIDYVADVKEIGEDFVRIWIYCSPESIKQIEPIEVILKVGKRASVDVTNDTLADVSIELRSISNGYAFLYFKEIKNAEEVKLPEGQKVLVEESGQEPLQMPKLELLPKIGPKTFLMMVIETFESWVKNMVQNAVNNKQYSIPVSLLILLLIVFSFRHYLKNPSIKNEGLPVKKRKIWPYLLALTILILIIICLIFRMKGYDTIVFEKLNTLKEFILTLFEKIFKP